jgi:hypothetical protein
MSESFWRCATGAEDQQYRTFRAGSSVFLVYRRPVNRATNEPAVDPIQVMSNVNLSWSGPPLIDLTDELADPTAVPLGGDRLEEEVDDRLVRSRTA